MNASSTPDHIESYRICGPLGAGGMGLVFEAVHEILGTKVAIKLAAPHVRKDPVLRARFLNEARALSLIDHPGIVRIIGCGQMDVAGADPILYIVMELLRGQTLRARMAEGPVAIEEARRIGLQVAEALKEVHRHGLVHRDVKPANIMLLDESSRQAAGTVKIIDFGIAKVPHSTQTAGMASPQTQLETGDDVRLGTPGYMAPEQCLDPSVATAQSDAYAFGVVLYELLGGHPPFEGDTRAELVRQHVYGKPPPLRRRREPIPANLRRLVMRLLDKAPEARPDLETACRTLRARTAGAGRRWRWAAATAGILMVGVGALLISREPVLGWLVERELKRAQLEAGTVAEAQQAVIRARRWLSLFAQGQKDSFPLARARITHKDSDVAEQEGRLDVARDGYLQTAALYRVSIQRCSIDCATVRDRLAASSNELAQVLRHLGRDAEAAEWFSRGVAEHDILVHLPEAAERRRFLRTLVLYRRAELAADLGDPRAAALFAEVRKILELLYAAGPANANVSWHLARVLVGEAALLARSGQGEPARAQVERALRLVQEARRLAPAWRRPKIAEVEEARSGIFETLGDIEAARASLHAAYSRWQETVAEEPRGIYRHAWLMVCRKGAQLQQGSLRDGYIRTATRLIDEFEREGLYQGDVHVREARAWFAALRSPSQ